ncbi:EF-hand domain-containing protein [Aequorivita echinoideorum]|uniref:EF-hand domain-containing protein n=1 Tax=Aequorivita echinoideorum TaxID=1549647 RepID=A0ABS5S3I4_9FLAO|nr:hypothetical protein [Aequorivita echinoideorum]MBT0607005.1 hypothetical protein [Aequorivita echinoideorum]
MKKTKILFLAAVMIAAVGFAQTPLQIKDLNNDGSYDIDEFSNSYSKGYNDYDADKDGRINDVEFYDTTYNRLDINRDGRLTNEEWTAGNRYYGNYIPANRYANNPPQYISRAEFADRFKDTDYYRSYDTNSDGYIDSSEMNQNTFNLIDKNKDGTLDADELKDFQ